MQQPAKLNYKVYQGSTFQESYRWESETKVYVPISTVSKSAPCEILTQISHGLPTGWRFRIVGVGGMKEINSIGDGFYIATDAYNDTIEINSVNSLGYSTYTSGGVIEYNQPAPLEGYSARMQIRETIDSETVLYETNSGIGGHIAIDTTFETIMITIPAEVTQEFEFETAVYSLELYKSDRVVPFITGNLTLVREVTR